MPETSKPTRASRKALRLAWKETREGPVARTPAASNGRALALRVQPRYTNGKRFGWEWVALTVDEAEGTEGAPVRYHPGHVGRAPEPLSTPLQAQVAGEEWLAQTLATWSAWATAAEAAPRG